MLRKQNLLRKQNFDQVILIAYMLKALVRSGTAFTFVFEFVSFMFDAANHSSIRPVGK